METIGNIEIIFDTEVISDKFKKREVVIKTTEKYPQLLKIQFTQDKTLLLDNYKKGDKVRIGLNLKGNAWVDKDGNNKYFNTIEGWRIAHDQADQSESIPVKAEVESDEDLPF